jgi:hypothetical protein
MDIAKKAFGEVEDGAFPRGQDIYAFFLISFYAKSYRGVAGCSCYQYNLGLGQDRSKVLHFEQFERFCSFAKVIHAIKVFLCKQNVFEKYSDVWLRLRSRMVGDCVNKWFTKVPDNEKAQSLDLMYSTWPAWMITESVARRYWHHRLEFSRVLSKTSLYSVVVKSVKTIALYYHKLVGGGVERVIMGLAKIYVEMGCKVIIISDVQGPSDFIELPEGVQDGILTAKEISLMDLRDAELVVLSACETAKGDITSEGVFGLQRAFKMAGAKTIIMSLWKVDDRATQLLMTEFYTNWITKKQAKRVAFRNAQNIVKKQYSEPSYWAGFVMLD